GHEIPSTGTRAWHGHRANAGRLLVTTSVGLHMCVCVLEISNFGVMLTIPCLPATAIIRIQSVKRPLPKFQVRASLLLLKRTSAMKHNTIPHTAIDALLGADRDPILVGKATNDPPPKLVRVFVNQDVPNAV